MLMRILRPWLQFLIAIALMSAACSGGGGSHATPAPTDSPPSIEAIRAYIGQGFINQEIGYELTLIDNFRDPVQVIALADKCAANDAGGLAAEDPNFWPTVLGNCFTAGDATMRLYQYTGRDDFLRANEEIRRLHRAKLDEANAHGANIGEDYWTRVVAAVYSQIPFTPTPEATTSAGAG
jgi:hypothetical protein